MKILSVIDTLANVTPRPLSRRAAVRRMGGIGAGLALAALPAVLTTWGSRAQASTARSQSTNDVLNFLLKLEWMKASFYGAGLETADLIPAEDRAVYQQIHKQELEHVQVWEEILAAAALPKPAWDYTAGGAYPDTLTNYATFQAMSQSFEDLAVRAYQGQMAALLSQSAVLTPALRILAVEGRHAAEARRVRGQKPWISFNNSDSASLSGVYAGEENHIQAGVDVGGGGAASQAFDEPLTMSQCLAITDQFIAPPPVAA